MYPKLYSVMKSFLLIPLVFLSFFTFGQIPNGYYNSANGTGFILKTQLYNIINGHTNNGYAGLWTTYATSDRDNQYENDNTMFDLYSENPTGQDPVTFLYITDQCGAYDSQGDCYNREHIIPQSIYNSASPMVADAHFVIPVDGYVNGQRSNNPHGNVSVASWTSFNGSKSGSSAVVGYSGTVFEPLDDFKGDIARMYFYFATRYENLVSNYTNYPMFNGSSDQVFQDNFLTMLLEWHIDDPVSSREIARNNAIYLRQDNRNPFIDHPEYVSSIWMPTPEDQVISFPPIANQVYGNPNLSLNATATSGFPVSYISSNTNVATINGNVLTVTGVGTTVISAFQIGNESFNPAPTITQSLQVLQKALTVTANVNTKVYDGTTSATLSGNLVGIVGTDNVTINGTGVFSSPNVGTGINVISTSTLVGNNSNNYTLIQPTGLIGNISPRMIIIE